MEIFLPIINFELGLYTLLFLSLIVGVLCGLFGIGGGFFLTPILIFLGIPASFAVPNVANSILGISVSGAVTHWYKKTMDYKMGFFIVIGGLFGTILGLFLFKLLKEVGNLNEVIALTYMYLLTILGTLIFVQGIKEINNIKKNIVVFKKIHFHFWIHGLPFRTRFKKSKLYISALAPIILGFLVGVIAAILGIGGAFLMVPALIYIFSMPTKLVPGTSLFVTVFITIFVVAGHALEFGSIDITLVTILLLGSLFGLHIGIKISDNLNASEYKTLLAILLIAVGILIGIETFVFDIFDKVANLSSTITNPAVNNSINLFIKNQSINSPLLYSLSCILIVCFMGYAFSFIRKIARDYIDTKKAKRTNQ